MMNISSIKTHMYCPMKLYIQNHIDVEKNKDYQLAIEIKKLKIDIQDLIQKNMRKVRKEMSLVEIENILSENINPYIESTTNAIKSMDLNIDEEQINEIIQDTYFNIKITALKTKQSMSIMDKHAFAIIDLFFPNCMYSYLLKDPQLELIGMCDKIEIITGKRIEEPLTELYSTSWLPRTTMKSKEPGEIPFMNLKESHKSKLTS